MGSRERCASVQVILWLNNVHHLVGVELKHAFHFRVLCTISGFLSRFARLPHLYLLPSLAFPDASKVPDKQKGNIALRCKVIRKAVCHSMYCSTSRNPRTKAQSLSVTRKKHPIITINEIMYKVYSAPPFESEIPLTGTYPWQAVFSSTNSDYEKGGGVNGNKYRKINPRFNKY